MPGVDAPPRVLFLCTGNSCRSQMAEGLARELLAGRIQAFSAGTAPKGVDPRAVRVMGEVGIDISRHKSKRPEEAANAAGGGFDLVVTLCGDARESCPTLPGARLLHAGFDDPPALAAGAASEEEALAPYRAVRDRIREFARSLPERIAAEAVHEKVRAGYGAIAARGAGAGGGGCCGPAACSSDDLARGVGYAAGDLAALPDGANLGLSCGNPTALASLAPGETVLDLGSGAGFDCFVAGPKVGPSGRVIGVDMTAEMLARAQANLAKYRRASGLDNVEFRQGRIEELPVDDRSIDVVLSNCVLNLSPDKARVWREIARVLKPGGRVAVADLAQRKPLPEPLRDDLATLLGCAAGAPPIESTRRWMAEAGLERIELVPKGGYVDLLAGSDDPLIRKIVAALPAGATPADYLTSLDITARKPR